MTWNAIPKAAPHYSFVMNAMCKGSASSPGHVLMQVHDFLSQPIFEEFPNSTFIEVGYDSFCGEKTMHKAARTLIMCLCIKGTLCLRGMCHLHADMS